MAERAGQIGRRAALSFLAALPLTVRRALAQPASYSLVLSPVNALLGERLRLRLECRTSRAAMITTFDDASLGLTMRRQSSSGEPELVFPNRRAVQEGGRLVRLGDAARRRLQPSQRLEREFDLVATFPRLALDVGDFQLDYEIDDAGQLRRAGPASVTIESGPEAIPRLLDLLSDGDTDVRERAAGLVHRMTAQVVGYDAMDQGGEQRAAIERWKSWWGKVGSKLAWNFRSAGASFGQVGSSPSHNRRSRVLGGIAYGRRALDAADGRTLHAVLTAWLRAPASGVAALRGATRVGDRAFVYPPDDTMIEPDEDTVQLLASALSSWARGASAHPDSRAALLILMTMAKMPDRRFTPVLAELRDSLSKSPGWSDVRAVLGGVLDVLDPSRTPVGDER